MAWKAVALDAKLLAYLDANKLSCESYCKTIKRMLNIEPIHKPEDIKPYVKPGPKPLYQFDTLKVHDSIVIHWGNASREKIHPAIKAMGRFNRLSGRVLVYNCVGVNITITRIK